MKFIYNFTIYDVLIIFCLSLSKSVSGFISSVVIPIFPTLVGIHFNSSIISSYPNYASIGNNYSYPYYQLSMLYVTKNLAQIFMGPVAGVIINIFGSLVVLLIGVCFHIPTLLLYGIGDMYYFLFIGRIADAVSAIAINGAVTSFIAFQFNDHKKRGFALGVSELCHNFGVAAGPAYGGLMFQYYSKSAAFLTILIFVGIEIIFVVVIYQGHKKWPKNIENNRSNSANRRMWAESNKIDINERAAPHAEVKLCRNITNNPRVLNSQINSCNIQISRSHRHHNNVNSNGNINQRNGVKTSRGSSPRDTNLTKTSSSERIRPQLRNIGDGNVLRVSLRNSINSSQNIVTQSKNGNELHVNYNNGSVGINNHKSSQRNVSNPRHSEQSKMQRKHQLQRTHDNNSYGRMSQSSSDRHSSRTPLTQMPVTSSEDQVRRHLKSSQRKPPEILPTTNAPPQIFIQRCHNQSKKCNNNVLMFFKDPYFLILLAVFPCVLISVFLLYSSLPQYMAIRFNSSESQQGIVWLATLFGFSFGFLFGNLINAKCSRWRHVTLILFTCIHAAAIFCLSFMPTWWSISIPLCFIILIHMMGEIVLAPILITIVETRHDSKFGTMSGILLTVASISIALGSFLGPILLSNIGLMYMDIGIGIMSLIYAPFLLFLRKFCISK